MAIATTSLNFLKFWARCFVVGWQTGHWGVAMLQGTFFAIYAVLYLKEKWRHHIGMWEVKVKTWSFTLFLWSFIVATFLIGPFVQWHDSDNELKKIRPSEKMVQWSSPKISDTWNQFEVLLGGHFEN